MTCKKTSFCNEQFAKDYINKLQKTSSRYKIPQRAYLCPDCLNWHLTSHIDGDDLKYNNMVKNYESQIKNLINDIKNRDKFISDLKQKITKLQRELDTYNKYYLNKMDL
jgi:hypothetical protein